MDRRYPLYRRCLQVFQGRKLTQPFNLDSVKFMPDLIQTHDSICWLQKKNKTKKKTNKKAGGDADGKLKKEKVSKFFCMQHSRKLLHSSSSHGAVH